MDMGIGLLEGTQQSPADHCAVFVICFRQHDDVLADRAAGEGIAPAQIGPDGVGQLTHDLLLAGFAQRLPGSAGEGQQQNVGCAAAALHGPALHIAQNLEIIVIALQRAGNQIRLLQVLQQLVSISSVHSMVGLVWQ